MPLFVALQRPHVAADSVRPGLGAVQLAHLSAAVAARYGVAIQAEAVLQEEPGQILILEAADRESVEAFMSFFTRWGEVRVLSACTAEEAVARSTHGGEPLSSPDRREEHHTLEPV